MDNLLNIDSPNKQLSLQISPKFGGAVTSFTFNTPSKPLDIFRPWDQTTPLSYPPLMTSSFPMTPYTNRIANGRLVFEGKEFQIGPAFTPEPHALHGDGWRSDWDVLSHSPNSAGLTLFKGKNAQTPYIYSASQTYTLDNNALHIDLSVTNKSDYALPFGIGHHPFLPRDSQTILRANLKTFWSGDDIIPDKISPVPINWNFAQGCVLSNENLGPPKSGFDKSFLMDHCFPDWDGMTEIFWPQRNLRLQITADPIFENFVICVPQPDMPFFCAEAVTNIIDAFNKHEKNTPNTGTRILMPGETLSGRTSFRPQSD